MLQSEGDSPHGKSAPKWRQGSSEGARPAGVRKFHPVCTSGIPAVPPPHLPVCAECQRNKTFLNELTVLWELVRFSFSVILFSEVLKVVLVKFTLYGLFFTSRKIKPAWLVRRSQGAGPPRAGGGTWAKGLHCGRWCRSNNRNSRCPGRQEKPV